MTWLNRWPAPWVRIRSPHSDVWSPLIPSLSAHDHCSYKTGSRSQHKTYEIRCALKIDVLGEQGDERHRHNDLEVEQQQVGDPTASPLSKQRSATLLAE